MRTRNTIPFLRVLAELGSSARGRCGADLMNELGLPSGTVYPLLERLRAEGLATTVRERGSSRVYAQLTEAGRAELQRAQDWARQEYQQAQGRADALHSALNAIGAR